MGWVVTMTLPDLAELTHMCQGTPDTGLDRAERVSDHQGNPDDRIAAVSASAPEPRRNLTAEWIASRDPLTVVLWFDADNDVKGFDALGDYAEMFWLPIIGPTATLTLRRFCQWTDQAPSGLRVGLGSLAATLGVGKGTSHNSSVVRTLTRLVDFGLARREGDSLAVRRMVPIVPVRLAERFPAGLADRHRQVIEALAIAAES